MVGGRPERTCHVCSRDRDSSFENLCIVERGERGHSQGSKKQTCAREEHEGVLEAAWSRMKLRFREAARADISAIHAHIAKWSREGAANVARDIYAACRLIAEHPFAAPETSDPSVRVKHLIRFPYNIFYIVGTRRVEILHIRHTSRREWI